MTDEEFEDLKLTIEILTGKLEISQQIYAKETGQRYVPPIRLNRKDLIEDSIRWDTSGTMYQPLKM